MVTTCPCSRRRDRALPERAVCRILVSGAHAATMRAVTTRARSASRTRRRSSSRSTPRRLTRVGASGATERSLRSWRSTRRRSATSAIAPAQPEAITADPDAVVVVIMPELIFRGSRRCCTTNGLSTSSGCSCSNLGWSSRRCPTGSTDQPRSCNTSTPIAKASKRRRSTSPMFSPSWAAAWHRGTAQHAPVRRRPSRRPAPERS